MPPKSNPIKIHYFPPNYNSTSGVRSNTQQTTVVQYHMARVQPTDPIRITDTPANIVMLQQMCYLRNNNAAHPYSVSDIINCPMPRPHTRGHRGRLKSEATSSRTDSSQQGKIISLSKPESQMAATRLQLYRQSQRSASCKQRRPQRQPKASATPLTQFGGKSTSWG